MMYEYTDETLEEGKTYYFRAVAADSEGNTAASEITKLYVDKVTCSEEKNLIKNGGFEEAELTYGGYWNLQDQKEPFNIVHITDGVAGDNVYSGKGGIYKITRIWQYVDVEPDTDYVLTFRYKFDEVEGYWNCVCGVINDYPTTGGDMGNYFTGPMSAIRILDKNKDGNWHTYSTTFNSGDFDDLAVAFYAWHGGASQTDYDAIVDWYIDDVYLFKAE